mmetsp:Transcript_34922/g.104175  ORF Transcript_34922/g.104175 Transcript_34922/m.104175 type:complete len:238 (+) Transcript_34922:1193-1906(+)
MSLELLAIRLGSGGRQVSTVPSHHLVEDEHAGVGGRFRHNVLEKEGALIGGGISPEGLFDGDDVVVDRLGHANDNNLSAVLLEDVLGQLGRLSVGVVSADGVDDVDVVSEELLGGSLEGSVALLDVATGHAVLDIGQLHSRVTNGTAPNLVQLSGVGPLVLGQQKRIASQYTLVTVGVHPNRQSLDLPLLQRLRPVLGQMCDGRREARSESSGRHHGDVHDALGLQFVVVGGGRHDC